MFHIYLGGQLIYQPLDASLALFNPKLTLEMGKAGSLEFDIPPNNVYYNNVRQLTSMVTVDMDGTEIFRGRVLSNERMFNNVRHIYCEGDLAFLVDSVQKTEKYTGTTRALFNKIIAAHNSRVEASKRFAVGQVTIDDREIVITGQSDDLNTGEIDYRQIAIDSIVGEWSDSLELIQTCLIDYCGGYLRTRYQNGVNYIDFVKEYGGTATQEIELGKNLLDLSEEISVEDLFTVLIPLGDDNLTIASINGGRDEIVDEDAVALYGRIVRTHVFNNVNDPTTLAENGIRYLLNNINVPRTVTITAVDLHILDKNIAAIRLGDRVHISSGPHSMDEYLVCTKIEYDMSNPANDKYTFGNPKQSLTERYKEDKRIQNDVYGNSASGGGGGRGGGGGGGAAAAEAAADAAEAIAEEVTEETERKIGEFFDTYIDLDPEDDGHIKLGSFYKEWTGAKEILLNDVGIDLDIATGNINIKSLKNMVDSNYQAIGEQNARIDVLQEDTQVSLSALTERIEEVDGVHQEHYTEIRQVSSQNASQISIVAGELQDETNRAKAKEASIDLIVENQQSQINIKADKINLDAAVTRINNLEADFADLDKLRARISNLGYASVGQLDVNSLDADSIAIGETPVYHRDHYHSLMANSEGKVSMGTATYSSANASFNIADTKFYKDGVKAAKTEGAQSATLRSLGISSVGSPYVYDGHRYEDATIAWTVQATKGDGSLYTISDTIKKAVNVDAAYQAGVDSFEAVTVYVLGSSTTKYDSGGSASGRDVGSSVDTTYLYHSWDGVNFSPWRPSSSVYYGGSSYSYNLRGSSGRYYNSGGAQTYYRKK